MSFFFPFPFKKNREEKKGLNNQRLRSLAHATKPSTKKKKKVYSINEKEGRKNQVSCPIIVVVP
jgi:hypothetical protein